MCIFSQPRHLYFAAETLSWGGQPESSDAERLVLEALDAYAAAPACDRSFGHEANTRIALAIARIFHGDVDGAADALTPVLELSPAQHPHSMVTAAERVRTALGALQASGRDAVELAGAIEGWTAERLTQAR